MLLCTPFGQYLESATTMSFPTSSYCIRVVAFCRHCKTNIIMLKVSINMFSLYVRILSVSSAAAFSTPFTLSSAVLCLNVFLLILIISHYPSTLKLCILLRVSRNTFNDISVFSNLSRRW
jgi:hypothetical protein